MSTASIMQRWESKQVSVDEISEKVANGSNVYIGSTAATAEAILGALVKDWKLVDIQIIQMIPGGSLPHLDPSISLDRFRTSSYYSFTKTAGFVAAGMADYTPMPITAVTRLLEEEMVRVDVAIIKVTPPHKGFCSLGMGVESTRAIIRHAKVVLAEVNAHMPWTEGHSTISLDEIDWWVQHDERLGTAVELWPEMQNNPTPEEAVLDGIGRNLVKHVANGATLKLDLTPAASAVLRFLNERENIGIHSDLYTEELFQLQDAGVINNTQKDHHKGRTIVSQAVGSQELYQFIDRNPAVEFYSSRHINDVQILAQIDNLVAIVGGLKVDLTGQVATASIAHKFYGGPWSTEDSIRGATYSKGGKPIVALTSKSLRGRSNIVFALPPGTGVDVTRCDVHYVVTEFGTAYLYGKPIRERCLALINIAHPDYRDELLAEAKAQNYIHSEQPGKSLMSKYPQEWECKHTTKKGNEVFVRPIKAVDEDLLRTFFHKLSDQSIYMRYFRRMHSLPQKILRKFSDIDYSQDMSLVVLYPPNDTAHWELVAIAQWISPSYEEEDAGVPEIAFQVRDDWQGQGLGKYLFSKLIEMAHAFGISKFKADVLSDNTAMNSVFTNSGIPFNRRADFGVYSYRFDLSSGDEKKV